MSEPYRPLVDAYAPAEIADLVRTKGVTKAQLDVLSMFVLAVLAGAFIGLGAVLSTVVSTGTGLGFGPTRWLAGLAFSVGLMLVIIAGAELFTGNNLIAMAWVSRQVSTARLLRSWAVVYAGNFVGALSIAVMVYLADWWQTGAAAGVTFGQTAVRIAAGKTALTFVPAFVRGVLCNALVCLALWLAMAGRTVVDKVFAILFPIAAFVAAGFEHSVANMYFIQAEHLVVHEQVTKLESFTSALADGVVTKQELGKQEAQLVAALKTLEPQLNDAQHDQVTRVLVDDVRLQRDGAAARAASRAREEGVRGSVWSHAVRYRGARADGVHGELPDPEHVLGFRQRGRQAWFLAHLIAS